MFRTFFLDIAHLISNKCTLHSLAMASFVSSLDLDAAKRQKKEKRREMREKILKDAREDYEKRKKREEMKRTTGEDKWVSSGVSERLGLSSERKRKKKSKKGHKPKKSKRSKYSKEDVSTDSDSAEDMWIEKTNLAEGKSGVTSNDADQSIKPAQRDEWMTTPLSSSLLSICSDRAGRKQEDVKESQNKVMIL